jgi:hypothetical protein
MPEVSRSTLSFSQMVTDLYPYFLAHSNAARQILRAAPRLMMHTEIASSGPGTAVNGLNLECDASAVDIFGVLPEDNSIHQRLLETSDGSLAEAGFPRDRRSVRWSRTPGRCGRGRDLLVGEAG